MSITYRPPFDEDDERDLRALYRKPGPGANPELDAAVRRRWHPGHSWHPGWGAVACAVMVAGLFAWTDMREADDPSDPSMQVVAVQGAEPAQAAAVPSSSATTEAPPLRRVVALQQEPAVAQPAVATAPASIEAPVAAQSTSQEPTADAQAEAIAFTDEDVAARVAQIRGLIVDDREEEAVQALRELQRGAPDFALPDDLQELSRQHPA